MMHDPLYNIVENMWRRLSAYQAYLVCGEDSNIKLNKIKIGLKPSETQEALPRLHIYM